MGILDDPGAPMAGGHVGDGEFARAVAIPPVQFHHIAEAQVGDQIYNVMRHYDDRRRGTPAPRLLNDGAQRWPMQMVKVGMRNQHQVNGRKVAKLISRLEQALWQKQPARKMGIDSDILAADLSEKAGVADEG